MDVIELIEGLYEVISNFPKSNPKQHYHKQHLNFPLEVMRPIKHCVRCHTQQIIKTDDIPQKQSKGMILFSVLEKWSPGFEKWITKRLVIMVGTNIFHH